MIIDKIIEDIHNRGVFYIPIALEQKIRNVLNTTLSITDGGEFCIINSFGIYHIIVISKYCYYQVDIIKDCNTIIDQGYTIESVTVALNTLQTIKTRSKSSRTTSTLTFDYYNTEIEYYSKHTYVPEFLKKIQEASMNLKLERERK